MCPLQSPFFDGKQPNWFHYSCFFKTSQPRSTSEVSGFSGLRPPDQDKLRDKIQGEPLPLQGGCGLPSSATPPPPAGVDASDGPASGGGKAKGKGRVTTRADLQVEYAKSSRSSCRGCNSSIEKGVMRVAKMEQPDPTERAYGGLLPRWHHVDCFLERAAELEADGVAAEELSGFTKLGKEEQKELRGKFGGSSKKAGK